MNTNSHHPDRRRPARCIAIGLLLLLVPFRPCVRAQDGQYDWSQGRELHPGIRFVRIEADQPRKMVVHGLRIDAHTPGLDLHTTTRRSEWVEGQAETDRQTTRDFLRQSRSRGVPMVVAINADAFSPWPAPYDQSTPTDLLGLAVSCGEPVSRGSGTPSFLRTKSGELRIALTNRETDTSDIELAVSGFAQCLLDGQPQPGNEDLHPRTGLGVSADARYVVAIAIDGRQPASAGATTQELGQWLKFFGAYQGINMDGGGSTTMAWWDPSASGEDKCQLLNTPVGNGVKAESLPAASFKSTERANGNNLGVSITPRADADAVPAEEPFLARGSQPQAAILIGPDSGPFYRWLASELQRYVRALSGAELPIATTNALPPQRTLIVLGGPAVNPLAASAEQQGLVRFAELKPDGLIVRTTDLDGRPAVVVGGNDEPGTMYAAYELLEQLGIVFQLTNDIIPEKKADLPLPMLDLRREPALKHRGMHCCHGIRWYMGLQDFREEIDQLAKLKLNVLQFYWGMGGPWAEFSYGGKKAEIIYPAESGYCAWAWNSGTAQSVKIGRECFPHDYLGPPEFAQVKTQDDAYSAAREFLREIIRYAHSRHVQVWLAIGEITYVPPNLADRGTTSLGFGPFYCGVAIPHGDPAVLDIYEAAVRSMIETYPEADRYWVCTGSEAHIAADDPRTQTLIRDYEHLRPLLPQKPPAAQDTDLADVAVAAQLMSRIKSRYPLARLGAEMIFRGGQLRALDAALPKDVWLMNMVNWDGETAMSDFAGIQERELVVWPRITDDGGELNIQLNAMMYDHEETISSSVRHGVTGVVGQLNKARGAEPSALFIAQGAWNPQIRCQPFYEDYLRRLFGPHVLDGLLKAYMLLEENEKSLGWHGRKGLFGTYHHGNRMGVALRQVDYRLVPLPVDRKQLEQDMQATNQEREFWIGRATHCRQALELLRQARPSVPPGSRDELDYVIFKTNNYVTVLDELAAAHEAQTAFDRTWLAISSGDADEVLRLLEETRVSLDRANRLVVEAAQQMIPYAHIPTERHILYLFNDALPSHEAAQAYLAEVTAFWKARNAGDPKE